MALEDKPWKNCLGSWHMKQIIFYVSCATNRETGLYWVGRCKASVHFLTTGFKPFPFPYAQTSHFVVFDVSLP
jgi:hypothetical protein